MIAVDLLVERQGLPAVIEYFRLFSKRNNRQANFTAAFGQPLSEFDEKFSQHLASLIAKQGQVKFQALSVRLPASVPS
jgi:hypothetical protein